MESAMIDAVYFILLAMGMFAHYMKKRVRNENTIDNKNEWQKIIEYFSDSFWKTTFPTILAALSFMYASLSQAPEFFYPLNKMGLMWMLMTGYTSDSLLNGETTQIKKP